MNSQERQRLAQLEKRFYLHSALSNSYWDGRFNYVPNKIEAIQLKGPQVQRLLQYLNIYDQNYSAIPVDE